MKIGDKIICIDDSHWDTSKHPDARISAGTIYTVRGLHPVRPDLAIYVEGIYGCPYEKNGIEIGIRRDRFKLFYDFCLEQLTEVNSCTQFA